MEKITKSPRNYGIDLLRIVSMFMVVVIHIINNGAMPETDGVIQPRYYPVYILGLMVVCAVNCYALVSGYVGYGRKIKYTNLAVLWLRVLWYSVLITVVFYIFVYKNFNIFEIIPSFFPVIKQTYWYFTSYFLMFIFTPLMNIALENMNRTQLRVLIYSIMFLVSVYPLLMIIFNISDPFKLSKGYSAWWLAFLYIIGGYIRKYDIFSHTKQAKALISYLAFVIGAFLFKFLFEYVLNNILGLGIKLDFMSEYTPIFAVGTAVSLLVFFKNLKIKEGFTKIISFVSSLVFSVYLIHTNHTIFNRYIVNKLIFLSQMPMWKEIPCILGLALAIFVACIIIDIPREYLFKKLKLKERIYKIEEKITAKIKSDD